MVYAQAKANVMAMEPRVGMLRECIQEMEDGAVEATTMVGSTSVHATMDAILAMLKSIHKVQLIQLNSALREGEDNLNQSRQVITQIESKIKIFRPAGFTPNPGA